MIYTGKVGGKDKGGETKKKDKDQVWVLLIKGSKKFIFDFCYTVLTWLVLKTYRWVNIFLGKSTIFAPM